jgi:hypothetical protein
MIRPSEWNMTDEQRKARQSIRCKIRKGVYPQMMFAKGPDGKLERVRVGRRMKLTWRRVSVLEALS